MNISQSCLDIIKEFEGLRLDAYLDPVNIPTIGYGTIRYPDGRKVRLGDSISEAEAEAFLASECNTIGSKVSALTTGVTLKQNQYDALVSFCYNLGVGAFAGSTLLRQLKASNFPAAASEFLNWNKATVNGVKQVLPGLTRRREAEKALFESRARGGVPFEPSVSVQEQVVSAKGFRDGNANVVAGFSDAGQAIDIVELDDRLADTLIAALRAYPNLKDFEFAKPGDPVPAGTRSHVSGRARPLPKNGDIPTLQRQLLLIGMEDDEDHPGNDIRELQARLVELGYLHGPVDGIFGPLTDGAVKDFQEDFFGESEADGRVGPLTWGKLWGDANPPPLPPGQAAAGKNYLKVTKNGQRDGVGLAVLDLAYYRNGLLADRLEACSGQARKQNFRTGVNSPAGSMEPLPEGKWTVGDIEWADGKDNFSGVVWNNGLGPAKIRLDYVGPGTTRRSAIEIHIDWNRPGAPGTAGCLGLRNIADFKTLVTWLRETNPRSLFVDWGLGTCPAP